MIFKVPSNPNHPVIPKRKTRGGFSLGKKSSGLVSFDEQLPARTQQQPLLGRALLPFLPLASCGCAHIWGAGGRALRDAQAEGFSADGEGTGRAAGTWLAPGCPKPE